MKSSDFQITTPDGGVRAELDLRCGEVCSAEDAIEAFSRIAGQGGGYHPAALLRCFPIAPLTPQGVAEAVAAAWDSALARSRREGGTCHPRAIRVESRGRLFQLGWESSLGLGVCLEFFTWEGKSGGRLVPNRIFLFCPTARPPEAAGWEEKSPGDRVAHRLYALNVKRAGR